MEDYENRIKEKQVKHLPHGRVFVKYYCYLKSDDISEEYKTLMVYTGYLEREGGWLHIYEDTGKTFSIPRRRVIRIEWDERWKEAKKKEAKQMAEAVL